ncbi:hypothetical protein BH24BAC1_BH24BAC1_28930 [soil metagenome]
MSQTVVGIFENKDDAQDAVQDLVRAGLSQERIALTAQSHTGTAGTTSGTYDSTSTTSGTYDNASTTTGTYDRDDRDDDSISNFFRNLFGGSDEARDYAEVGRRGWIVTVHASSRQEAERSAEILDDHGAVDVNERASQDRSGASQGTQAYASGSASPTTDSPDKSDTSIQIIEEKAEIGKRVVETGGARIRSRIVERPIEESLRLREEHLSVERNRVDRPATEEDLANFKEGDMKVTERAEVPVVNKEARVVEEIKLNKDVDEHTETVRDTVRKTEVDVDKISPEDFDRSTDRDRDSYDRDSSDRDPSTRR